MLVARSFGNPFKILEFRFRFLFDGEHGDRDFLGKSRTGKSAYLSGTRHRRSVTNRFSTHYPQNRANLMR